MADEEMESLTLDLCKLQTMEDATEMAFQTIAYEVSTVC